MNFSNLDQDVFIHENSFKRMEQHGTSGVAFLSPPPKFKDEYIRVSQYALQPISEEDKISNNSYVVCFIGK